MGITKFTKKFTAIALSLLLGQPTFAQSTENQQMAFEGSLTDTSGNPLNLASQALTFYISANGCYLYSEWATAGDSLGNINHRFGNGTLSASSPNAFSQNLFFGNVNGKTIATDSPCSVTAADTRLAEVFYPGEGISATIKLGTVPYAQNATMLGGKTASQFVQTSTDTNTLFSGGAAGQYLTKSASGLTWTTSTLTSAQISSALGYTPASTTTLTASSVTTALGYTPANTTALSNYTLRSNNLSDLTSATTARTNLGLGTLATKNSVDLSTVEVAGTLPATKLPSMGGDVSNSTGSGNITVTRIRNVAVTSATPITGQVLAYDGAAWTPTSVPAGVGTVTNVSSANSDIIITNSTTTPTLTLNAGSSGNQILRLDSIGRLPPIDASNITTLNASQLSFGTLPTGRLPAFSGDIMTASGSSVVTVNRLRGVSISTTAPVSGQVLSYSGTEWVPVNPPAGVGAMQGVNNLSEISSANAARTNLGLGSLATKNAVSLNTAEVSGILPVANGGSKWTQGVYGIYSVSNTTIGSSTTSTNTALYVTAPTSTGSTIAASINNNNSSGFGLKINTENASAAYYGLRVSAFDSTNFVVLNNGNVGVGLSAPGARLQIAGGSTSLPGFRLTSGSLTSTPMPGSVEYDGSSYYVTDGNSVRRTVATGSAANSIDNVSNINSTSTITLSTPNSVVVSSTVASTNYQSGALIVKGGLGVNGNGNFSGSVNATGSISTSGSITTPNNVFAGAVTTPFLYGSTASGGSLAIDSTSDAGKGNIIIAGNGGKVGIGTVNPLYRFHVKSPEPNIYTSVISSSSGPAMIGTAEDDYNQLYSIGYNASGQPSWFFTTGGTNYLMNNVSLGNPLEIPNNKLSVHGNAYITANATVSKTLMLNGSTSSVPIQFLTTAITATAVSNSIESDGTSLFYTNSSAQRRRLAGGVAANSIDNVSKITYGGNLILEGNTASVTPAVTINNLGSGTIGLQVNDSAIVSGSIKLSSDGADTNVTCTAADEGKQRYNKALKTMEFCDGAYWNGTNGVTHCEAPTTGYGAGTSYTLIGNPGTGSAFCMSKQKLQNTFNAAVEDCSNRSASNGSRMALCSDIQYFDACKQYTLAGAAAETKLPSYRGYMYWSTSLKSDGAPSYYYALGFGSGTANVCAPTDKYEGSFPEDNVNVNYRCCYQ